MGADVNVMHPLNQNTPLHSATFGGHSDVVQVLMKLGADPLIRNNLGQTAVALANIQKFAKIEALLVKGTRPSRSSSSNSSASSASALSSSGGATTPSSGGHTFGSLSKSTGLSTFTALIGSPKKKITKKPTVTSGGSPPGSSSPTLTTKHSHTPSSPTPKPFHPSIAIPPMASIPSFKPYPSTPTTPSTSSIPSTPTASIISPPVPRKSHTPSNSISAPIPVLPDKGLIFSAIAKADVPFLDRWQATCSALGRPLTSFINTLKDEEHGNSPLLYTAARFGHLKVVEWLLERGANVNEKQGSGSTPLHGAAWVGNLEICKLLLRKGANVFEKNNLGETALQNAQVQEFGEIITLLHNAEKGIIG